MEQELPGFNALEWLEGVADAAMLVRDHERLSEERREVATSYGATIKEVNVSSSPSMDVMAPIDALVMADEANARLVASAMAEVASARLVFAGMRAIGYEERVAADVLEMRYVSLVPVSVVADSLGVSPSTVRRRGDYGIDWLSAHGLAHAKAGLGMA